MKTKALFSGGQLQSVAAAVCVGHVWWWPHSGSLAAPLVPPSCLACALPPPLLRMNVQVLGQNSTGPPSPST